MAAHQTHILSPLFATPHHPLIPVPLCYSALPTPTRPPLTLQVGTILFFDVLFSLPFEKTFFLLKSLCNCFLILYSINPISHCLSPLLLWSLFLYIYTITMMPLNSVLCFALNLALGVRV